MADPHPLDVLRDKLIPTMKKAASIKATDPIPKELLTTFRDVLVCRLEDGENVCARDAIRIADAWVHGRPTPINWRYK